MFVRDSTHTSEKDTELSERVNFLTYNLACLPPIFGMQYNKSILDPNLVRARKFVDHILQSSFDIIALQEVWDIAVADYLVEALKERYPHYIKGVNGNYQSYFIQLLRSGLMIFSKYPIVDTYMHCFGNHMVGEESVSFKSVIAAKFKKDRAHFITVYNTHLHAYGALFNTLSTWHGGSSYARRDEQMRIISEHIKIWAKKSPENSGLIHLQTILMGDLNVGLNNEREALSISAGAVKQNLRRNEIEFLGQYHLLSKFYLKLPDNFSPKESAKQENKFTGTDNLGSSSREAPDKIFDAMFMSREGAGELKTQIVAFDAKSQRPLSDHFGIQGQYDPNKASGEKKDKLGDVLEVRERIPSSVCERLCGSRSRYYMRWLYREPVEVKEENNLPKKIAQTPSIP